jgi:hypothetical protein
MIIQYDLTDVFKIILNKLSFGLYRLPVQEIQITDSGNLRVDQIYFQNFFDDKSFTEKPGWLNSVDHEHQRELRDTWEQGIKTGIQVGLESASLEGQRIELTNNTTNPRHVEFLQKHYALCTEYNVAIQYHPKLGLVIINQKPDYL